MVACNVIHDGLTCAEQDNSTGGSNALRLAKKKLGIEDCPHCGIEIE